MRYSQMFPHMYTVQSNQIILQWEFWVESASLFFRWVKMSFSEQVLAYI